MLLNTLWLKTVCIGGFALICNTTIILLFSPFITIIVEYSRNHFKNVDNFIFGCKSFSKRKKKQNSQKLQVCKWRNDVLGLYNNYNTENWIFCFRSFITFHNLFLINPTCQTEVINFIILFFLIAGIT